MGGATRVVTLGHKILGGVKFLQQSSNNKFKIVPTPRTENLPVFEHFLPELDLDDPELAHVCQQSKHGGLQPPMLPLQSMRWGGELAPHFSPLKQEPLPWSSPKPTSSLLDMPMEGGRQNLMNSIALLRIIGRCPVTLCACKCEGRVCSNEDSDPCFAHSQVYLHPLAFALLM